MLHGPRLGDPFLHPAQPVPGADGPHLVQFQIRIADQPFDDVRLGLVATGLEFERKQVGDRHNLERTVFTHDHDHSIKVRYRGFGSSGERVLVSLPALARATPSSGLPPHPSNAISGPAHPHAAEKFPRGQAHGFALLKPRVGTRAVSDRCRYELRCWPAQTGTCDGRPAR